MSIEQTLERIATALETLAGCSTATASIGSAATAQAVGAVSSGWASGESLKAGDIVTVQAAPPPPVRRGRPPKPVDPTPAQSAPAAAPPALVPSQPTVTAQSPETPTSSVAISAKQTTEAILDLANNHSREAAVAILKKYGANKCSELKAEHLTAAFNEAMAAKGPAQDAPVAPASLV